MRGGASGAAGFTAFALSLAAGRVGGDRLVERHGRVAVVRGGALVGACEVAVALLAGPAGLTAALGVMVAAALTAALLAGAALVPRRRRAGRAIRCSTSG